MVIELIQGDITKVEADAIVNDAQFIIVRRRWC